MTVNKQTNKFLWFKVCCLTIALFLLSSCTHPTPAKEFAPEVEIVQKALAVRWQQTEQNLAQQLNASLPEIEISKIQVQKTKPLFIDKLPTYHLEGKYNLRLKFPHRQVKQVNNSFDIYLQRQEEDNTWRLLERDRTKSTWTSYLIK
ncbi:hypothetical protein IQ238_27005 [Pleurocapsales cyanobacterium LEGE 06147]|nr:hypothetical protein [Pleurocapsales cyanobacterium LEGE 06147]